jgi:PAS domain S-box-containing protein
MFRAIEEKQDGWVEEYRFQRRDGSYADLLDRAYVSRNVDGKAVRMLGAVMDITQRKRSELQYRALFENVNDAVFLVEIRPDGTFGRFLQVNEMVCSRLGYSREELLQMSPQDIDAPEYAGQRATALSVTLRSERNLFQMEQVTKAGTRIPVELSTHIFRIGEQRQLLAVSRDISERKRAEQELLQAKQTAETASRAKGEFLANMSHEIRTPINGVLGMSELLLDTDLTREQREYLLMLKSSGESLLTVINEILDFSKVESGKLELDAIEFNLHDSMGETMRSLALRAHQKGLELVYEIAPDVPVYVAGDPGRLRQILVNLVGNAIKFTDRGEVIVLTRCNARDDQELELQFSVTDTGIGIPPEKHSLIFEAFAQADSGTTRQFGGTGLGLAISARLAGLMGGRIWVESSVGRGSTFHFTARLGVAANQHAPAMQNFQADLLRLPVLIVDDNATNRRILTEMTRDWGMEASSAENGPAALEALKEAESGGRCFRLALLDANMPGMDGFELAERMKKDPQLSGALIMMLTSSGQHGDAARCRKLGVAAYLLKPIRRSELLSAILTVLGQATTESSPSLVTRHTLRESSRGLRILVAEDNRVNQVLVLRLLEKLGHSVALANNGLEALTQTGAQTFDLIFMDVQMPEMDGFTATQKIREIETRTGLHVPIIAMTAHAMKGDKERCLAAGMDGYLSKPLNIHDIQKTIARILNHSASENPLPVRPVSWDAAAALERVGGDEKLLREIVQIFVEETPKLMVILRQALISDDVEQLESTAHSLKGELGYLGAASLSQKARELEESAQRRDLARAAALLSVFESEIAELVVSMRAAGAVV